MSTKEYADLDVLNQKSREIIKTKVNTIIDEFKKTDYTKSLGIIQFIPKNLKNTYRSILLNKERPKEGKVINQHPIRPIRGQIYNAYLGENLGSELSGDHPVIIIQNTEGNLFSQKVNVIPIEGDGNKVKEPYQMKLTSDNLENGIKLSKDPSRIIISDIMTIDKTRLGLKVGQIKEEKMKLISKSIIKQLSLDKL